MNDTPIKILKGKKKASAIGQWQKKSYSKLQKRNFPLVILSIAHDNKLCKNSSGFESLGLGD